MNTAANRVHLLAYYAASFIAPGFGSELGFLKAHSALSVGSLGFLLKPGGWIGCSKLSLGVNVCAWRPEITPC